MPRRSIKKDQFADTATGRPISHCPLEILELASNRVPLRRVEIHTLAVSSGEQVVSLQRLAQLENEAIAKIKEAFTGLSLLDFEPEKSRASNRRRRAR